MRPCHDIEPHLSLLVDGLLSPEEATRVRAHVAGCAACRGVLSDLERLRPAAGQLGPIAPPQHVWLEVAGQIRMDGPGRAGMRSGQPRPSAMWQWIGLAAALVLITVGLYVFQRAPIAPAPAPTTADNAPPAGSVEAVTDQLTLATEHYEKAIAQLEGMAASGDNTIDPAVAGVVRDSLGAIDLAIADSRAALSSNPESESARDSLFEALRRKIAVLQATVSLINEMRVGDQEGAAEAAKGLGKKS